MCPDNAGGQQDLTSHPDRLRWNKRYSEDYRPSFDAHLLAVRALSMPLPAGTVLDLACGPSGSAIYAAERGRAVTAVDASDVALGMLADEAARRGLDQLISVVHADLHSWRPSPASYALVLCTGYWDRNVFGAAADAVSADGAIGWEAFTQAARTDRPHLPADWCLLPGEPGTLLPPGFAVLSQQEVAGNRRRLLAKRTL
jgi:SAM-dependent methyltransferase